MFIFRPIINDKHSDRLIGEGPSLTMAFQLDEDMQNLKTKIMKDISLNFKRVEYFLTRLDDIQEFYSENCLMNTDVIVHEKSMLWYSLTI